MQEQTTQQLIQESFQELPKVVQDAIHNSGWEQKIRKIVSDHNLLLDQGLAIEKETFLMMLGLEDAKNYAKNIKKMASLDSDQAISIAEEVNETILKTIKGEIIKVSQEVVGVEPSFMDDVLGYTKELEDQLPSIDTSLIEPTEIADRNQVIGELDSSIKIIDNEEDDLMIPPKDDLMIPFEKEASIIPPKKEDPIIPLEKDPVPTQKTNITIHAEIEPEEIGVATKTKEVEEFVIEEPESKKIKEEDLEWSLEPKPGDSIKIDTSDAKKENPITIDLRKPKKPIGKYGLPDLEQLRTLETDAEKIEGRSHKKKKVEIPKEDQEEIKQEDREVEQDRKNIENISEIPAPLEPKETLSQTDQQIEKMVEEKLEKLSPQKTEEVYQQNVVDQEQIPAPQVKMPEPKKEVVTNITSQPKRGSDPYREPIE